MIVERNGEFFVYSKEGNKLDGPYKTRRQAEQRLREIEYFKHKKDDSASDD